MADNNSLTFLTDSGLQEYNNFLQNYLVEHFQEKGESDCRLEEIEITEIYNKKSNGLYCCVVSVQPRRGIVPRFEFEIVLKYIEDSTTDEMHFNNIVSYSLLDVGGTYEDLTLDSCSITTRSDLKVDITYNSQTYSYVLKYFIKNVDTDNNEGSMGDGGRYHLSPIIAKTDKDSDYCEALLKAGKMPYIIFKRHREHGEDYANDQEIFYPISGYEMYESEYMTKSQSLIYFKLLAYSDETYGLSLNYLIEMPHEEEQVEYIKRLSYDELKSLRDGGKLVPGMQYRIDNYMTTTIQTNTTATGNTFDIIVTADSANTLNENARAIMHDGNSYFANNKLEAWQIKYCLDNDSARFAWADPNGYGVIYYMKDEFGNECPYDFKNILFLRQYANKVFCGPGAHAVGYDDHKILDQMCLENSRLIASGGSWLYTFSDANDRDASLSFHYDPDDLDACYGAGGNVIGQYMNDGKMELANNVFCNVKVCYSNRFGNNATRNTFNTPTVIYNTFGNSIYDNNFASDTDLNNNEISYNTFGNYIHTNTFGSYVQHNTFNTGTYFNVFGHTVLRNSFGNNFSYNTFRDGTYANTMLNDVFNNSFGNDIDSNMFGNQISGNTFENKIYRNTIGNRNYDNKYGKCISQCTIDDCVNNNDFNSCIKALSVGSMVKYCKVQGGLDESHCITYCQILSGTNNQTIAFEVGRKALQVAGLKENGTLKIWMPAETLQ